MPAGVGTRPSDFIASYQSQCVTLYATGHDLKEDALLLQSNPRSTRNRVSVKHSIIPLYPRILMIPLLRQKIEDNISYLLVLVN